MQFFSIICPLAAIAGLVSAVMIPTGPGMIGRIANPLEYSSREGKVVKRAEPGFYFCNEPDYKGLCFRDQSAFGTCVTVKDDFIGVPDEFNSSISSVKVNDRTHCVLYRQALSLLVLAIQHLVL
ncbi:hypothetical protein MMC29_000343 [Sticta canariensis]|nr:hypothetical protein [Sticta canariensis]